MESSTLEQHATNDGVVKPEEIRTFPTIVVMVAKIVSLHRVFELDIAKAPIQVITKIIPPHLLMSNLFFI